MPHFASDCCEPKKMSNHPSDCCQARPSAKQTLLQAAKGLREKAHQLEKLADELGHLGPDADAALWDMVTRTF